MMAASLTRPLNTSIQIPPHPNHSQLVSPITVGTPGEQGSPTPTPGAEQQRRTFWSPVNSPDGDMKQIFWAHGNTGNTPISERRQGFFSPAHSPIAEHQPSELWVAPKSPSVAAGFPERKSSLLVPPSSSSVPQHRMKGHKVSWSDSSWDSDRSKGMSSQEADSSQSDTSRPGSPYAKQRNARSRLTASTAEEPPDVRNVRARVVEYIDKRSMALARDLSPPPTPREPPFVSYTETFGQILGMDPTMELVLQDRRAPFFGGSGCFHRSTSTLFITSALLKDPSPGSVSSRNWNSVTSSITFFADNDTTRDKVRFSENYMPGGTCIWYPATAGPKPQQSIDSHSRSSSSASFASSLIFCARGTLSTPAGLIQVSPKRPHTVTPLLTHYPGGRVFNSPHSIVALSDGSLLFTDPAVGYEVGYRPRPQMPPLVHRFDPATGDVRALVDGMTRPTCIAVSPDQRTVYIVDAPRGRKMPGKTAHFEDVLEVCCAPQPTIQAFSLVGVTQGMNAGQSGVFLHNKRTFAFPGLPAGQEPTGLTVTARGDVLAACGESGVLVYSKEGVLVGKIRPPNGDAINGLCMGRRGELFAWGGGKVWRICLDAGRLG